MQAATYDMCSNPKHIKTQTSSCVDHGEWAVGFAPANARPAAIARAVASHRRWILRNDERVRSARRRLKGKRLGTTRHGTSGHADVLAEVANCSDSYLAMLMTEERERASQCGDGYQ